MAAVELTLEQILDAVRQLPAGQREVLLKAVAQLPLPGEARSVAKRVRRKHQLSRSQRDRMSLLLAKGNADTLTAVESRELNRLVEQFERNTLEMARDLARPGQPTPRAKASR